MPALIVTIAARPRQLTGSSVLFGTAVTLSSAVGSRSTVSTRPGIWGRRRNLNAPKSSGVQIAWELTDHLFTRELSALGEVVTRFGSNTGL
jgi:hypothetical protein